MNDNCILVLEYQCFGFEHSSFNAALISTIKEAYPDKQVVFTAEVNHLSFVRSCLEKHGFDVNGVIWEEIKVFARNGSFFHGIKNELTWSRLFFQLCSKYHPFTVFICSINAAGIINLKLSFCLRRFALPTYAFVHGTLSELSKDVLQRPWSIRNAIKFLPLQKLKFVALGSPILNAVVKYVPSSRNQWVSLNLPYLWRELPNTYLPKESPVITFGFFGAANAAKGFNKFSQIAYQFRNKHINVEFLLVGFCWGYNSDEGTSNYVQGVSGKPLSATEFHNRASKVTYSVWLADPDHYELTASATFLDSIAYAIPGIYLRNPFVEYYFEEMGDIGYLCDSIGEVIELVEMLSVDFPRSRFESQVNNILKNRMIFSPKYLASEVQKWSSTI